MQMLAPESEYWPATQFWHGFDIIPLPEAYFPAAQSTQLARRLDPDPVL